MGLRFLLPSGKGRKALLAEFRNRWKKGVEFERDFDLIGKYYRLTLDARRREPLDDKTWSDLDMDEIFSKLDRNVSSVGRQYLYRMLRYCEDDETILADRSHQCKVLTDDKDLRESIQLILNKLSSDKASFIAHLLFDPLPQKPRLFGLIYLSSAMAIFSTAMLLFAEQFFFVLLALGINNIVINMVYGRRVYEHFAGLSYLNTMLGAAISLAGLKNERGLPQLDYLQENTETARSLDKRIGWLVMDKSRMDPISEIFVEYLNLICLFDLVAFIRSLAPLKEHREGCIRIFEAVASLDAMISVASWRDALPDWCIPEIDRGCKLEAENVYHPLLENPISNSITLGNDSVLVTGSNMAGKTTFIKTIGVNVILGRTLHVCLAGKCRIPAVMVKSSIGREETLNGGKSYYFAEVERLRDFISLSGAGDGSYLFLIDEIYRGTNTIERISAATAVLGHLGRKNMVMATTHDIELQELLDGRYRMCHFSEQVSGERFYFDYRLKDGPTRSRNAIRLLELSGYPESVTGQATSLAQDFSKRYNEKNPASNRA